MIGLVFVFALFAFHLFHIENDGSKTPIFVGKFLAHLMQTNGLLFFWFGVGFYE